MGAERIILTHFSQRYPKVPVFDACFSEQTSIAFDLMRVPFNQLQQLPRLTAAYQELFPEEGGDRDADADEAEGDAAAADEEAKLKGKAAAP